MSFAPEPPCDFNVLHHSYHGYVARCARCERIHVAFGTTVTAFRDAAFYEHVQTVRAARRLRTPGDCRHQKCVQLPTPSPAVQLTLTLEELEAYDTLLAAAESALRKALLFAFSNN